MRGHLGNPRHVIAEGFPFVGLLPVESMRNRLQFLEGDPPSTSQQLRCQPGQTAGRPSHYFHQIGGGETLRGHPDSDPGQRRSQHRPLQYLTTEGGSKGNARFYKGCVDGKQRRVHPAKHCDLVRWRVLEPGAYPHRGLQRQLCTGVDVDGKPGRACGRNRSANDLVDATLVVAEQVGSSLHHRGRTAVVDLERMEGSAREQLFVVDQERGVCA